MEETSKKEILEAISLFASNVDQRFDTLEAKMEKGFADIRAEIKEVKVELLAKIDALDKRSDEDTCANMTDYLKLKVRVEKLEKHFGQVQPA
ncbi:MAG: hypothetical protein ABIJ23_01580 [Candidatus Magasanikbacteria bacterium]